MPKWPVHLWDPLLPHTHHYIHPLTVHFPIVLFMLELACLIINIPKRSKTLLKASRTFLYLGAASLLATVPAGLYDAGVDMKTGNAILAGLQDRLTNYTHFSDPLSVHVFYVSMFDLTVLIRLIWALKMRKSSRQMSGWFTALAAIGVWLMIAAAQVGGSLTYP